MTNKKKGNVFYNIISLSHKLNPSEQKKDTDNSSQILSDDTVIKTQTSLSDKLKPDSDESRNQEKK